MKTLLAPDTMWSVAIREGDDLKEVAQVDGEIRAFFIAKSFQEAGVDAIHYKSQVAAPMSAEARPF